MNYFLKLLSGLIGGKSIFTKKSFTRENLVKDFSTNQSTQQFQEVVHQFFEYIRIWATPFFSNVVPCESP